MSVRTYVCVSVCVQSVKVKSQVIQEKLLSILVVVLLLLLLTCLLQFNFLAVAVVLRLERTKQIQIFVHK
jgi:hypothetical protein